MWKFSFYKSFIFATWLLLSVHARAKVLCEELFYNSLIWQKGSPFVALENWLDEMTVIHGPDNLRLPKKRPEADGPQQKLQLRVVKGGRQADQSLYAQKKMLIETAEKYLRLLEQESNFKSQLEKSFEFKFQPYNLTRQDFEKLKKQNFDDVGFSYFFKSGTGLSDFNKPAQTKLRIIPELPSSSIMEKLYFIKTPFPITELAFTNYMRHLLVDEEVINKAINNIKAGEGISLRSLSLYSDHSLHLAEAPDMKQVLLVHLFILELYRGKYSIAKERNYQQKVSRLLLDSYFWEAPPRVKMSRLLSLSDGQIIKEKELAMELIASLPEHPSLQECYNLGLAFYGLILNEFPDSRPSYRHQITLLKQMMESGENNLR